MGALKRHWMVLYACLILGLILFLLLAIPSFKEWRPEWHSAWEFTAHALITIVAVLVLHVIDRTLLVKEIVESLNGPTEKMHIAVLQTLNQSVAQMKLAEQAARCGLIEIYPTREEARTDVLRAIEKANSKVLLLGVAFTEKINLQEIAPLLDAKVAPDRDIRILILNALSSPAVFRSLLESLPENVRKMLAFHANGRAASGKVAKGSSPYFDSRLFRDFQSVVSLFTRHEELGKRHIKFYRHNPGMWMIMVDDEVFFEPYTFGRTIRQRHLPANLCLGGQMPVFRFKGQDHCRTYSILADHFDRLWRTTSDDVLHAQIALGNKDSLINKIFGDRIEWLSNVAKSLAGLVRPHAGDAAVSPEDRRVFPRQNYSLGLNMVISTITSPCSLVDCSQGGVGLVLHGTGPLVKGTRFTVEVRPGAAANQHTYLCENLLEGGEFEAMWSKARADDPNTIEVGAMIVA